MNQRMMDHKREQEHEHGHAASASGAVREGTIRLTTAQALDALSSPRNASRPKTVSAPSRSLAACSRSSVTATSRAWERRCISIATNCPTLRAHNEQAMAHSAIAYAKAHFRRRMMACHDVDRTGRDESGRLAAALAHVQPFAGAAAAGRHFRVARAGPGFAAGRRLPRRWRVRQRCVQTRVALFRSHRASRRNC